jgi:hypothetical protein
MIISTAAAIAPAMAASKIIAYSFFSLGLPGQSD